VPVLGLRAGLGWGWGTNPFPFLDQPGISNSLALKKISQILDPIRFSYKSYFFN
jgi:hypothetical protein